MGTSAADFQHHQVGTEEEPPGSAGRVGVLQLQEDLQQPEVHEFHRYMVMVSCGCVVQLSISLSILLVLMPSIAAKEDVNQLAKPPKHILFLMLTASIWKADPRLLGLGSH